MDSTITQQRLYYARRELGLCVKCGAAVEETKYKCCESCRQRYRTFAERAWSKDRRREYQKNYREEIERMCTRIAIAVQQLIAAEELVNVSYKAVDADHKCWGCQWATWCGDRFFCPLYGNCSKSNEKKGEQHDPV